MAGVVAAITESQLPMSVKEPLCSPEEFPSSADGPHSPLCTLHPALEWWASCLAVQFDVGSAFAWFSNREAIPAPNHFPLAHFLYWLACRVQFYWPKV
jgi:hypothetical protein